MQHIAVLLFPEFETLDVFGPVEIFGRLKDKYQVQFYSIDGGLVGNSHGVSILTESMDSIILSHVFLVPGGYGTRVEVNHEVMLKKLVDWSAAADFVLTVCTGSGLLAKTGLLDGRLATSNKRAFDWAMQQGVKVRWLRKARWTVDDKFYTSAGVSAGMDMTLSFLWDRHGIDFAREVAKQIEYTWNEDKNKDEF